MRQVRETATRIANSADSASHTAIFAQESLAARLSAKTGGGERSQADAGRRRGRRSQQLHGGVVTTRQRHRVITDEQWARIEPLLPSNAGKRAQPFQNNRRIFEGIVYRYRAGIAWRDLPCQSFGPWQTVWKRHRRYAADGTWTECYLKPPRSVASIGASPSTAPSIVPTSTRRTRRALARTQGATSNCKYLPVREREPAGHGIGRSRGGLPTKFHQAVDGKGWLLAVVVTSEQRPDGVILPQVLADIRVPRTGDGRPRACPYAVLADRAYGSRGKREYLRSRGVRAVTPGKWGPDRDLEKTRQQRWTAPEFDAGAYRNRNLLERSFSYVKQWRGLATVRLTCHHLPGGSRDQRGPDKAPPIMETCPSGGLLRRGPYPEGVTFLAVGTPWIVSPTIYHLSAQRRLPRPCAIRVKIMHRSCNTPASFFSQRAARPLRCRGFDDC